MHFRKETEAISAILFVLLIFASLIIGGLIAYLGVMSSYYNMPKSPFVSVENTVFPQNDFTYFNVTVLNPSNAVSDVNVTGFDVIIEDQNATVNVTATEPSLPFLLRIGKSQNFKCIQNWSVFAGKTLRVEPLLGANASAISLPYVSMTVSGFDTSEDANHFNITVQNSQESTVNLTVTNISVFAVSVNFTSSLPAPIQAGQQEEFRCTYNWADASGESLVITVSTNTGFEQVYETGPLQGAFLTVSNVQFNSTNTGLFTMSVDSQNSQAPATLTGVNITLANNTTLTLGTIPVLNSSIAVPVPANGTRPIICLWNWSTHRDEQIIIQASTKEGFPAQSTTATVPSAVIWNATDIQFDLNDTEHFSVNVTSAPASLEEINITEVDLNLNATSMTPIVVVPANSSVVVCGYNWTSLIGENVNVTVHGVYGQNATTLSQTVTVPFLKVVKLSFLYFPTGNPYVNVTVFNSQNSPFTANITQISVTADNATSLIDGTLAVPEIGSTGYLLSTNTNVTFVCPWDWIPYSGQYVTFKVQTTEGTFSATLQAG